MNNHAKKNLNSKELEQINGGSLYENDLAGQLPYAFYKFVHNGCDGNILNYGNLKKSCVCDKCGETHYFLWMFDYTQKKK